ncbi:MAG: hypothetical protein U9P00_14715 [Pseudomonadota bacterium]|nr:hypothetical protein [Pseudomonadota bacterium]
MLVKKHLLPAKALSLITGLREDQAAGDEAQTTKLLTQSDHLFLQAASLLTE